MNNPTVSVIVPAYNVESYILKCIESILSSTFKDIEVIAIDDCSTDNTLGILRSIKDSRLQVISLQTQSGVSIARNTGIDRALGKYISFVDADDWVSPIMLECLVSTAEKTDADMVFCNHYIVYGDKTVNATSNIKKDLLLAGESGIAQYLHMLYIKDKKEYEPYFPMGQPWGTLYKASLIMENNIRFDEGMLYKEDVIFVMYVVQHSSKLIRLKEPLYYYNKTNSNSLTTSEFQKGMTSRIEKFLYEISVFILKYRQRDEVFKAGYYQYVFMCFYKGIVFDSIRDSSYVKCKDFYCSDLFIEAMRNLNVNKLSLLEKAIYFLLKYHGLPLFYFGVMAYMKIRRRK